MDFPMLSPEMVKIRTIYSVQIIILETWRWDKYKL